VYQIAGFRKAMRVAGVGLVAVATTWLVGGLTGVWSIGSGALAGHSGVRTIGSIAVAGCLLAAIGSWQR
jgi:hypothetical protein